MQTLLLAQVQWGQVGIVIGIFAAIAVLLTVCILLVAKFCKTNADEKVESILSHLAGANCGGCGCTGCSGFAEKLAKGEATLSDCHVTETAQKAAIAEILGVPFSAGKPTVSVCHCAGGQNAADAFTYNGAKDCAEENKLAGGHKSCKYGCLGDGNCSRVCPEGAISLPGGCAQTDDKCISCGACMLACPKKLFSPSPPTPGYISPAPRTRRARRSWMPARWAASPAASARASVRRARSRCRTIFPSSTTTSA